jgi:protein transport protein SEC24
MANMNLGAKPMMMMQGQPNNPFNNNMMAPAPPSSNVVATNMGAPHLPPTSNPLAGPPPPSIMTSNNNSNNNNNHPAFAPPPTNGVQNGAQSNLLAAKQMAPNQFAPANSMPPLPPMVSTVHPSQNGPPTMMNAPSDMTPKPTQILPSPPTSIQQPQQQQQQPPQNNFPQAVQAKPPLSFSNVNAPMMMPPQQLPAPSQNFPPNTGPQPMVNPSNFPPMPGMPPMPNQHRMANPMGPPHHPQMQPGYPLGGMPQQPSMNSNYPPQPGMQQGMYPQQQQQPGFPTSPLGPPANAQKRLDPDQMPNPIQVMAENQKSFGGVFSTAQVGQVPPLVTTKFITQDQGNSSPRYIRSTMYSVPATTDMMKQSAIPFALIISPFARLAEQEMTPPIVDFGEIGPIRCIRCKAYMSPNMQFIDAGRRFQCLLCKATTEGKF